MEENRMLAIAEGNLQLTDVKIEDEKLRFRMFIIENAKRELTRIIKLTDALDKFETSFIEAASNIVDDENTQDMQKVILLPKIMKTLTESLERAQNLVSQIANDEALLKSISIDVTNVQAINNFNTEVTDIAQNGQMDVLGREKIKKATQLLLQGMTKANTNEVIEVPAEEVTDDTGTKKEDSQCQQSPELIQKT